MKSNQANPADETAQPLAAGGGITTSADSTRNPYEAFEDLMVVVEALCPRWPSRGTFSTAGIWLL